MQVYLKLILNEPAKKLRLSIYSSRPGIIIGKKGADIETLKTISQKCLILKYF